MYRAILVPIDGSETSTLGLTEAIKLAKDQDASMRLVHIVNELVMTPTYDGGIGVAAILDSLREGGKALLQDAQARVREAGVPVDAICEEVIGGQAGVHIVQLAQAWRADLIVMGTHGRRGMRRMVMGSDAEYVVRHTPVPVLLIRRQSPPDK